VIEGGLGIGMRTVLDLEICGLVTRRDGGSTKT
jgi:hypothetical protein